MKRKLLIIIVLAIIPFCTLAQETEMSDFGKFKSYFEKLSKGSDWRSIDIPLELASKIIDNGRIISEMVQSVHPYAIFKKEDFTIFIIELGFPMGGYTAAFALLSFHHESIKQAEIIGQTTLTREGGRWTMISTINDTLLEVNSQELEFDEITDEEKVINTRNNYYIINSEGFYKVEMGRFSRDRLFSEASNRILEISELEEYQKTDLDIMRNEIFADHGYIFKTEKWKSYFKDKSWYKPQYHDVNNTLTVIEKINIERILQISSEKSE